VGQKNLLNLKKKKMYQEQVWELRQQKPLWNRNTVVLGAKCL